MLKFTSKQKTLDFEVDGDVKSIPLSLGLDRYKSLAKAMKGDTAGILKWFKDYVCEYADGCEGFGDAELDALLGEWNKARSAIGEASVGEA